MLRSIVRSERVIIVEDDRIRSVVIGPRQRLKPAFIAGLALMGMAATSLGWIVTLAKLHGARQETAAVAQGAEMLASQLQETRATVAGLSGQLGAAQAALAEGLSQEAELRRRLTLAADRLDAAQTAEGRTLRQAAAAARNELAAAEAGALTGTLEAAASSMREVEATSVTLATRRAQAAAAAVEVDAGRLDGGAAGEVLDGMGQALVAARAEAAGLRAEAGALQAQKEELARQAAEAERRVQAVNDAQVALLARLTEHADMRLGEMEGALKGTGIDLDAVLARVDEERFGVGGPLVQLPTEALAPAATEAMAQLESRLTRQARLRALFTLLPLSAPVDDFYVASGFGKRRDPFTKQWALHEGIDLNAQPGSPVMATAPGTVVEVGWEDGYGRNVLVDHGFGIRTRYAHLEKTVVKQGDTLGHGDQVGTLGNSGRSSGPHLHYEVLVGGRPVDPLRFMEKARHVCEG